MVSYNGLNVLLPIFYVRYSVLLPSGLESNDGSRTSVVGVFKSSDNSTVLFYFEDGEQQIVLTHEHHHIHRRCQAVIFEYVSAKNKTNKKKPKILDCLSEYLLLTVLHAETTACRCRILYCLKWSQHVVPWGKITTFVPDNIFSNPP